MHQPSCRPGWNCILKVGTPFPFVNSLIAASLLISIGMAHAQNLLFTDHPLAGKIWDMNSHDYIDEAAVLARMNQADIILLGETHDNPRHHELQQTLLNARIDSGARPAVLMEQFDADRQQDIDQALTGTDRSNKLKTLTGLISFSNPKPYLPILVTAVDNKLPVIAANISNRGLLPVIREDFSAFDATALKRLAVEEVWDHRRQNFMLSNMGGAHCGKLRDELRAGLVRSQRLRDAMMADAAMNGLRQGVVAIVGSGHARRDVGMPLYISARDPSARILSIAFVEVVPGKNSPDTYETDSASDVPPFDLIWFTPRVARKDPCADMEKGAPPTAPPPASTGKDNASDK